MEVTQESGGASLSLGQQLRDALQTDELSEALLAEHPEQFDVIDVRAARLAQHIEECRQEENR